MPIRTVKVMFGKAECSPLLVSDFNAGWIIMGIELRGNRQPSACGRMRYEMHHHARAAQRPPTPVAGDRAEHAMRNRVPFACAWRKVTHGDA